MIQNDTLNVKLTNSQITMLKSGMKNNTEETPKISWNIIDGSHNENDFSHKLLLINAQVSRLHKAFTNNSSTNRKLAKTQLHKIGQSGGFLGICLGPLLKTELSLMGNVIKLLAKSVSISLGLTAAAGAAIHKKMLSFYNTNNS